MTFDTDQGLVLQGQTLAVVVRPGAGRKVDLPAGLSGLFGPAFLVVVREAGTESELLGRQGLGLFFARPARVGVRPAFSVVLGVVGDDQACLRLYSSLGFPVEVGTLSWAEGHGSRELDWAEGDLKITMHVGHLAFPAVYTGRLAQCRADGPIMVPTRISGLARTGRAVVDGGDGAPLSFLRGRHRGAVVATARLVTQPARQPVGWLSSLRAPVLGPGPVGRGAGRPSDIESLTAVP